MRIEHRSVAELIPNPANWKTHPDRQRSALAASLENYGWLEPVIWNLTTGHLIDGHARVGQAVVTGQDTVPTVVLELSPTEEQAMLASVDKITAMAELDEPLELTLLEERIRATADILPSYLGDERAEEILQRFLAEIPDDNDGGGHGSGCGSETMTVMLMVPGADYDHFLAALGGLGEAWDLEGYPDTVLSAMEWERANGND